MRAFLHTKYSQILTAVLLVQAVLFYNASRGEIVPASRPLDEFPSAMDGWRLIQKGVIEKEEMDVLRADDVITRQYAGSQSRVPLNLFVAYFKTQRTGQAPHSPKNCLPGSGWMPSETGYVDVPVEGVAQPIRINRYLVSRGESSSVVLYWYQSRSRVVASEYAAKFWLVADSIRYHRSDTALVRVVSPVVRGDQAAATQSAIEFVRTVFPALRSYLPS